MTDIDQNQTAGFSESEKAKLFRAGFLGLIAAIATLWIGNVFEAEGPSLLSFEVVLASLASFVVAGIFSVMGESVIEDVVKMLMVSVMWRFTRKYMAIDLIAMGMLVGAGAGFINNRLPEKSGRKTE